MQSNFRTPAIYSLIMTSVLLLQPSLQGQEKRPSRDTRLAAVGGVAITEAQVREEGREDLEALELQRLLTQAASIRREHEILEAALESLLEEKLIEAEAARMKVSPEELLSREIPPNPEAPNQREIDAFYEANKNRITLPRDQATPQIAKYLAQQKQNQAKKAFIAKLEQKHPVHRYLEPLRFSVDAAVLPFRGDAKAPVSLVVFSDFQCPYCRTFNETLDKILSTYGNKVRLAFRQFPLTRIHPDAQRAAEASLCAGAQDRFWEMHDLLFQNQANLQADDLKRMAKQLGLNTEAFNACLESERFTNRIREDIRSGAASGTEGTPTLFINGRYLSGGRAYDDIAAVIDEELSRKK